MMTDTKDAAQVLRDAGWLVVEPDGWCIREIGIVELSPEPTLSVPLAITDTIDWSHVDPKYRYMARGKDGRAFLYDTRPIVQGDGYWWKTDCLSVEVSCFASYRRGTVPWDKSLVCREDEE